MRLYNTLTRRIDELPKKELITFYSCGQTVYGDLHIGNTRTYSFWDILVRWLRYNGRKVIHVQNLTDVGHLTDDADEGEDKMEVASRERNITPFELAEIQIKDYWIGMDKLNMLRPNISPRATAHIPEIIEHVKILLEKGHAYEVDGTIYFDVTTFSDYGKLSPSFTYMKEDANFHRTQVDSKKKNPQDFVLWFNADKKGHILRWPSPWGEGYPGWHIECSVMAQKYLGDTIDIHAGGIEHLALHHPNEIAQSEAKTGKLFARMWLHAKHLTINGVKMSKSKGNYYSIREILEKYPAQTLRLYYTTGHYRKPTDFVLERLDEAQGMLERIITSIKNAQEAAGGNKTSLQKLLKEFIQNFNSALNNDLDTPRANQHLMRFIKDLNANLDSKKEILEKSINQIFDFLNVLGIDILPLLEKKEDGKSRELLQLINRVRDELREQKIFELSDKIRSELLQLGFKIEDKS